MARKKEYVRLRKDSGQHRRILVVGAVLGLMAFVPAALRLYSLMVTNYDFYRRLALENQSRVTRIMGERGEIYDRNMNLLAGNESVENVYLAPLELNQSQADLQALSQTLGELLEEDPAEILNKAENTKLRYQQIARNVDRETADAIRNYVNETGISGVHLEPTTQRYYPYGSLASQVIGFANISGEGCEGVEAAYNSYLAGSLGQVITSKGNNEMEMPFSYEDFVEAGKGDSVILTIDATVQACLEKQMENAIARYDVQNGAFGMVMNAKTGEILAMATIGGYDPNNYLEIYDEEKALELEQLRLAYLGYELGADDYVTKPFSLAVLLAKTKALIRRSRGEDGEKLTCGAITLDSSFYCCGAEQIPGRAQLLHCWRSAGHGSEQTPQALQNSCNIAFAHIALQLGGERFYEYVQKFGVLEKTGIDLAGESKGVFFDKSTVTDTEKWGTASLTSGSFGQTFKLTPLQLVRAVAAVVNGGNLLEPYIVQEVVDAQGNTVLYQEPTVIRQVISEETSKTMCQLLQSVVEEGTAKNAQVAGFSIGGKTGTSEKIDVFDENGQRVLDKIVSFVGIAPMDDPEYIVLVALDTPSRETGIYISGGVMAAPTVGAVMADILPYLGVERSFSPEEAAGREIVLEDFTGMSVSDAQKKLKEMGLAGQIIGEDGVITDQIPGAGETIPGDSQVLLYCGEEAQERMVEVPDFYGLNRQQASDRAGELGLYILVTGNDSLSPQVVVTGQSLPAGTQVPVGTTIELQFADTQVSD